MAAARFDLKIEGNSSFSRTIFIDENGADKNLTGHSFSAEIRQSEDGPILQTLTVAVVDAPTGEISVSLTAAQTGALPSSKRGSIGFWDLLMKNDGSGEITRLLQGQVFVTPGYTASF